MSEEEQALEPIIRSVLEGMGDPALDDYSWMSNLQAVLALRLELNPDVSESVREVFGRVHDTIQEAMNELDPGI